MSGKVTFSKLDLRVEGGVWEYVCFGEKHWHWYEVSVHGLTFSIAAVVFLPDEFKVGSFLTILSGKSDFFQTSFKVGRRSLRICFRYHWYEVSVHSLTFSLASMVFLPDEVKVGSFLTILSGKSDFFQTCFKGGRRVLSLCLFWAKTLPLIWSFST